jgi:hypothetical protein
MNNYGFNHHCRLSRWAVTLAFALSVLLLLAARTAADIQGSQASVVRVEEDWELLVNHPEIAISSPQVSTQMARSLSTSRFVNLHLNSSDVPKFSQGGLQLQAWRGNINLAAQTSDNRNVMTTDNELVTWTQYLRNDNGTLKFGISASMSQTWGDFSGIEIAVPGASTNLNNYSADYSVSNSGVTFGANRVTWMLLTAVRVYYSDGTVQTDNTLRVVYASDQN